MVCIEKPITFLSNNYELFGVIHIPSTGFNSFTVMFHGFTGNKVEANRLFVDIARALCSDGKAVLRFDFRCHGDSPLPFEEFKLDYALEDAENAIRYVENVFRPSKIGLIGLSMGGHIAIKTAYRFKDRISSLILLAPAIDIGKLLEQAIDRLPKINGYFVFGAYRLKKEGVESILKSNAMDLAENIESPTLLIHAKNDEVVPHTQSIEFYNRLRIEKKKLVLLDEGGHVFSTITSKSRVVQEIVEWSGETL
ncbi:dienelactone hydrolase [Ignisphaera aggregans DSM 17230]|uniref:Dienelactone hydrolase n=1 Tax=Ignisphaera aggregans (strain DSM 17230 / JCM 13409 / AQ1.S1) TaxID=583356 RepID=E0SNK2_IGNAA|nr:dienelactone hydrolase [Ignisphaera aggregans DSM 17230]